jgi:hypothetical protein
MTVVHAETVCQIAAILAVATSLTALASPSFAFTAETAVHRRRIPPLQLRIPDIGRITACMLKNRSSLSSGCRIELDKGLVAKSHRVAAQ